MWLGPESRGAICPRVSATGTRLSAVPPLGKSGLLARGVFDRPRRPGRGRDAALGQHDDSGAPPRGGRVQKKGGQERQGLGRSRGGFTTKLHIAAADENTPVAFVLTPGQQHDVTVLDDLRGEVPPDCRPKTAVLDKGYASQEARRL